MTKAGLEKIAEAKANGEWDAAAIGEDVNSIPAELVRALKKNKGWESFQNWTASRKKQYLYWLNSAKKPETWRKRLQAIAEMAISRE